MPQTRSDTHTSLGGRGPGNNKPGKPGLAAQRRHSRALSARPPRREAPRLSGCQTALTAQERTAGSRKPPPVTWWCRHPSQSPLTASVLLPLPQLPEPGRPRGAGTALTLLCQPGPGPASGAAAATPTESMGHAGTGGRSSWVSPRGSNAPTAKPSGSSPVLGGRRAAHWPRVTRLSGDVSGAAEACPALAGLGLGLGRAA